MFPQDHFRAGLKKGVDNRENRYILLTSMKALAKHSGPTYKAWYNMLARCRNPQNVSWSDYGGRGIRVCEEWNSYERFLSDMGERPGKGLSLDRKDNNGNYNKDNCRWATAKEQGNNKRKAEHCVITRLRKRLLALGAEKRSSRADRILKELLELPHG